MNVVPASWLSPVSAFISMLWRGRGSVLGVLVLTNCCSVVLVPAPLEEYSVFSAQRSAGVSEARTTARVLLSSSLTSPCLLLHGPRPSVHRLALQTGLAAFPRCTSTWWFHVHCLARPSVVPTSLRSLGFRVISALEHATLHSVRAATTDQSGFFLELVETVVPEFAVQVTLPSGTIRGYVLDVDLASASGVVVVQLKQGLLVLTCWSYSRYFITLMLRCMGITCGLGTRTFNFSLRESDGSEGGGEFASMIRSQRMGGLLSSGHAVLGSRSLRSCGLFCSASYLQGPLVLTVPLSVTPCAFRGLQKPLPETPVRGWS